MKPPVLLLDCNFLCHRAWHVMGDLSHHALKTGVIYGFLREIANLKDRFGIQNVIFCFDLGRSRRVEMFSGYKRTRQQARTEASDEEKKSRDELQQQVDKLRTAYLPQIGYRNIRYQEGYEADDLIAYFCKTHCSGSPCHQAVIVSADGDLYQLLSSSVSMFNPSRKKLLTFANFFTHHGILSSEWWKVKALCGCATDDIPGIPGVGEKTAIKFLNAHRLNAPREKKFDKFYLPENKELYLRNKSLVKLPLPGVEPFYLEKDNLSREGWLAVCDQLGLSSLRDRNGFMSIREQRTAK